MASAARPSVLQMQGMSKTFPGVQALQDVDFEVYEGEIHGQQRGDAPHLAHHPHGDIERRRHLHQENRHQNNVGPRPQPREDQRRQKPPTHPTGLSIRSLTHSLHTKW